MNKPTRPATTPINPWNASRELASHNLIDDVATRQLGDTAPRMSAEHDAATGVQRTAQYVMDNLKTSPVLQAAIKGLHICGLN